MATEVFTNNAQTTLNGGITNSQTTIVVASNSGFPSTAQFRIVIDSEIMLVTAGMGGLTWTVTRGNNLVAPDTTTNATHNTGATVTHVLTAGSLTSYVLSPVPGVTWGLSTLLTLGSIANSYGLLINGPAGAGTSFGVKTVAGTNSADYSARFQTQAAVDVLAVRGDGKTVLSGSPAKVLGGATGVSMRNNADSADNLIWTDAGLLTLRNAIEVPPSAAGTIPTHSYGTVPVKIDDILIGTDSRYLAAPAIVTFLNTSNVGTNLLPTGFRHLLVEWYARGDSAATTIQVGIRVNNDGGANYDSQQLKGSGASATASELLGAGFGVIGTGTAATATANYFSQGFVLIRNYNGTVGNKLWTAESNYWTANTTGTGVNEVYSGKWRTTATAITRLDVVAGTGNFVAGSLFTLWGIP